MGVADRLLLAPVNRRALGVDLTRAILSIERTGSCEEKPGILATIADPGGRLMASENLTQPALRALGTPAAAMLRAIDLQLDGVWYRLNAAEREGDTTALTFDHRGAVYMSRHDTAMTASRKHTTRAEFIRRQVDEVAAKRGAAARLAFWTFKPGKRMPIAVDTSQVSPNSDSASDPAAIRERAKQGKGLVLRGKTVDAAQRHNMAVVLTRAETDGAGPKATLALIEACIVEAPDFTNPKGGDATSSGILQLLASTAAGLKVDPRDVDAVAHLFLTRGFTGRGGAIELAAKNPGRSAGWVAQSVQGSALPDRYDAVRADAERVLDAFGGIGIDSAGGGSYVKPYQFKRPEGIGAWKNTGDLAAEVNARRFITIPAPGSDLFVYGADIDMLRLDSQAVIVPDAPYVVGDFGYRLDYGSAVRVVTVTVRADAFESDFAWGIPVTLNHADAASGKYLVWSVREIDGSPDVELELRMPERRKPEPAAEVVQRSDGSTANVGSVSASGGAKGLVEDAFRIARNAGGRKVYVGSDYRPGSTTTSGNQSDHAGNDSRRAARDIGKKGVDLIKGPPSQELDRACVAVGHAFGRSYEEGSVVDADSFDFKGFRVQIIYRTPKYGGHMGHIHVGAHRL